MSSINSSDAAILAMIAQYDKIPVEERRQWLSELSPDAQAVGRNLLKENAPGDPPEAAEEAQSIQEWVDQNRRTNLAS